MTLAEQLDAPRDVCGHDYAPFNHCPQPHKDGGGSP